MNIEIVIGVKQEGYWEDWMNVKDITWAISLLYRMGQNIVNILELIVQYALAWFAADR
jgi:hypothetical protein